MMQEAWLYQPHVWELLVKGGMDKVGGLDVRNRAISVKPCTGRRGCHCKVWRGVSPRMIHSTPLTLQRADERPCFDLAVAGSIRVIHSLLDV